jgi:hypothetical protein
MITKPCSSAALKKPMIVDEALDGHRRRRRAASIRPDSRALSGLDARLMTPGGAVDGVDLRRRGVVTAVAILVVEVRILPCDGGGGLVIHILAIVTVAGALVGEVRAFLSGEREVGGRQDESGFANLIDQRSPGVLDPAAREDAVSAGLGLERGA